MFLSIEQINHSLDRLENFHPFYGISFLVAKAGKLPIGKTIEFPFDSEEKNFLDKYYKPLPETDYYLRVFRPSDKGKRWLSPKYPSSGSQSTRTRGRFSEALIHTRNTDIWGWHDDYVDILSQTPAFNRSGPIPAFHLAVWLFHDHEFSPGTKEKDLVDKFFSEFHINEREKKSLFDLSLEDLSPSIPFIQPNKFTLDELMVITGTPPDTEPEEGGTLAYIELRGIGPAKAIKIEPAKRVNIITGDNGLGKTFILDCAWWALSGNWASLPAYPRLDAARDEPKIIFQITGEKSFSEKTEVSYNWETQRWQTLAERPTIPGLLIYALVDGSFAVWDPAKTYMQSFVEPNESTGFFVFSKDEVWDGLEKVISGRTRILSNGLLRDWITWQNNPEKYPFEIFCRVLRTLSPPDSDLGLLEPGKSVRLPYDAREIPTIKHSYAEVPIIQASAGVRRIVALAYLIVWAWNEHITQSSLIKKPAQKRIVILIDEMEAHLHPQWQRVILPALLDLKYDLDSEIEFQYFILTHSPLVLASVEPRYEPDEDKLFHLDIVGLDLFEKTVEISQIPFVRYGPVDSWLLSDIFELRQARSIEAEKAIEEAKSLQTMEEPSVGDIERVSNDLKKYLAAEDDFWPRWKFFAEKHGVEI